MTIAQRLFFPGRVKILINFLRQIQLPANHFRLDNKLSFLLAVYQQPYQSGDGDFLSDRYE